MPVSKLRKAMFELTPLGKADKEVRGFLQHRVDEHEMERYISALTQYRHMKMIQATLKMLFYASLITSIAATVGLEGQIAFIQQIASYMGTSIIFVLFGVTSYLAMIRREAYHVRREILISKAAMDDLKFSGE